MVFLARRTASVLRFSMCGVGRCGCCFSGVEI